jgi:non-ribosomal peptide synthase protein (TIGR01720 family)
MIPAAFVVLEALPLTAHGKVDRRALPAPDSSRPALEDAFAAPRSPAEATLAQIWAEVLRLERVGVHDNFFALGGDSILSIQIIARAKQAGLHLTPKQIFQHQTIAELAAVVSTAPVVVAEQGPVEGFVALTPIQQQFFEQDLPDRQHFNQALLLEARQPLDAALLEQAVQQLMAHHDALRLRFTHETEGWQQHNAAAEPNTVFARMDLSTLPPDAQPPAIERAAADTQASLDLAQGPLVRVVLFDCGAQPSRLLLVIHHLAIDAVSWGTLLEDLQTAYTQLAQGAAPALPPKTSSFKHWTERLRAYAQSEALQAEAAYWLDVARRTVAQMPRDYSAGGNTLASARHIGVTLGESETRALLQEVPAAYQTQINDVLLTALAQAFAAWTGERALLIDLEGHGREDLFEDVDLSRTVGWFTTRFPVLLDLRGALGLGAALTAIKEQLRAIPNHGIGYGLLRYMSEETIAAQMRALPAAEVEFNYLGQGDQTTQEAGLFGPAHESSGPVHGLRGARGHVLEITAFIAEDRLHMNWTYSETVHRRRTIERLAEGYLSALQALIAHCRSPQAGGYTPSDFAQYQWSQEDIDDITAAIFESKVK